MWSLNQKRFIMEEETDSSNKRADLWGALVAQFMATVVVVIMFFVLLPPAQRSRVWHVGPMGSPSDPIRIDTWNRYIAAMVLLVVLEICSSYSSKMLRNWYRNDVRDSKSCTVGVGRYEMHTVVTLWYVLGILPRFLKFIIAFLTRQLQFLLPGYIVRIIISAWYDRIAYIEKTSRCAAVL
ncbi:MAG: hypothetical protein CL902_00520 [Dehalococcoidia bacterium]|nr:hypothetical protein [Dehalococcoidia bacterium]